MGIIVAFVFLTQMALTFFCALMSVLMSKNLMMMTGWDILSTTN